MVATTEKKETVQRSPLDSLSTVPWWALILAAAGMFFIYIVLSDTNYRDTFVFLIAGVVTTLRITLFAFPIAIVIGLGWIGNLRTVVARVANSVRIWITTSIKITVFLIRIKSHRAVITCIHNTVIVTIEITDITNSITVDVGLVGIANRRAIVTEITDPIII